MTVEGGFSHLSLYNAGPGELSVLIDPRGQTAVSYGTFPMRLLPHVTMSFNALMRPTKQFFTYALDKVFLKTFWVKRCICLYAIRSKAPKLITCF